MIRQQVFLQLGHVLFGRIFPGDRESSHRFREFASFRQCRGQGITELPGLIAVQDCQISGALQIHSQSG
jgi:hypothetical protein